MGQKEGVMSRGDVRRRARIELLPSEMIYIPRIRGASLNPFLGILRRASSPPSKRRCCAILSFISPPLLIDCPRLFQLLSLSSFLYFQYFRRSFLACLYLSISLETLGKVSRALHVSASGNCPVSQIMLLPSTPIPSFVVVRYDTCKHKSLARTLYKHNSSCTDTSHSYVTTREKAFS